MWPLGPHHARTTLISVVRVQPRASEGITDLLSTPECGNTTTEHMVFEPSKTQREREEREREGKRIKKDLTSIFYPSPPSSLFSLDVHLIHTKQFGDSPPPRFPIMFSFSNSRTYTGGFPPHVFSFAFYQTWTNHHNHKNFANRTLEGQRLSPFDRGRTDSSVTPNILYAEKGVSRLIVNKKRRSRSLPDSTRQIAPPTRSGHAPLFRESGKKSQPVHHCTVLIW